MSNRREKIDPRQMEFDWDFPSKLEKVLHEREELKDRVIEGPPKLMKTENEFELCVLLAAGIKRAIDESGLGRKQIPGLINDYFGRTEDGVKEDTPSCRNPMTLNMLNNYLSKPAECPIPAYYLFAIHHITDSLEPARVMVEMEGARIATGSEIRQLNIGKLEEHIIEIKKLKKELQCQR